MTRPGIEVRFKGKLLTGDPTRIVREETQRAVQEAVEMGEEHVNELARRRPLGVFLSFAQAGKRASKGNFRRNIHSQVRALRGIISDGGIIYGPWLEGTSRRNQTTRFKGYAMFRRTKQWLDSKKGGIQRKMAGRIVRRLNSR